MAKRKTLTDDQKIQQKLKEIEEMEALLKIKEGLPHLYGFPWYRWAKDFFDSTDKMAFLTAANQVSKPQCVQTEIPTPTGFKRLEDINVGDFVFGQNGVPTRVIDIPYVGTDEAYDIVFNDGSHVIAGKTHDWICKGYKERFRKKYTNNRKGSRAFGEKFENNSYGSWIIKNTEEIIKCGNYRPNTEAQKRFSIPITAPAEMEDQHLFSPYLVGLYIGNGSDRSICFNNQDTDVIQKIADGNKIKSEPRSGRTSVYLKNETYHLLKKLNLTTQSYNKTIPNSYMISSITQRKELLAGLMDTDGTCDKRGSNYNYSTTSENLANQVLELTCSLGGMGQIKKYPSYYYKDTGEKIMCRDHYVVTIWTEFNPFLSKRKANRWKLNSRYKHERVITEIHPVGKKRMKCITVDNEDGSFLCTRNYIVTHNSSTQIRLFIDWATDITKWKKLWPNLLPGQKPNQFWYFYPTSDVWQTEFETKWEPDFLPRGPYKDHPVYGWKDVYEKGIIKKIEFNSGVTIYCKTYAQKVKDLQSGSVHVMGLDEEAPADYMPELQARIRATNGYIRSVFTATLGQEFWRRVMEPNNSEEELFPHAFKRTVSLYDSQTYIDGSPSRWTNERIQEVIQECATDAEVQRRVFGRFVKSEGLKYESFDLERNMIAPTIIPQSWGVFTGVDPGSGGKSGHPAAIIFIAVRPDYKEGIVFKGWRGDGIPTANPDILQKFRELKGNQLTMAQVYDYKDKDFFLVAQSYGEPFSMANKTRDEGEGLLNSLFKNGMLKIIKGDPELNKLTTELLSLSNNTDKRKAKDDMIDATRYTVMAIPWDFSGIIDLSKKAKDKFNDPPPDTRTEAQKLTDEINKQRRAFVTGQGETQNQSEGAYDELNFWSDLME